MFISERDQDRDTKKEQALSITFSHSDWFISQNERFLLATYNKRKLLQEF